MVHYAKRDEKPQEKIKETRKEYMSYEKEKRRIYEILLALHPTMDEDELSGIIEQIVNDPFYEKKKLEFLNLMETRLENQAK